MGHVINPVSQRIGYSNFWNSNWSLASGSQIFSYNYISAEDLNLNTYLKKLFLYAGRCLFGKGLVFVNFKLLRFFGRVVLLIDIKLKQLINLYNAVELIFFNTSGLKNVKIQKIDSVKKTKKIHFFKLFKPSLLYNIKPKFLRRTIKLTPYNSAITEPDFRSYHWATITQNLYLSKQNPVSFYLKSKKASNGVLQKTNMSSVVVYLLLTRWLFIIKNFITTTLHRFYQKLPQFDIILSLLSTSALTASFIAKYLATRLLQKFPLRRLINLLIRQLKVACDAGNIHGFKIACNGRFERRGRATHTWKLLGKTPRSDINMQVDYSIMLPVLTNSICAVKVWLTKKYQNEKLLIL